MTEFLPRRGSITPAGVRLFLWVTGGLRQPATICRPFGTDEAFFTARQDHRRELLIISLSASRLDSALNEAKIPAIRLSPRGSFASAVRCTCCMTCTSMAQIVQPKMSTE